MKYNIDDVVWWVDYYKLRLECGLIHKVEKIPGTTKYYLGQWDSERLERDIYLTKEEAEQSLQQYLEYINKNKKKGEDNE